MEKELIYFDSAATSYYRPDCVKEAVAEAIDTFGNPSRGAYGASLSADRCLFETRLRLSQMFGADGPDCVAFTMNDTHALNEAIFGQDLKAGDHLIVSLQEHNSVLRPAYRLKERGVSVHFAGLQENGTFDIDSYRTILRDISRKVQTDVSDPDGRSDQSGTKARPRIVTVLAHGSNVTGSLIDLKEVSRLCHSYGSLLILDAAQTAGTIPIDMKRDGIDILCMSGHKALMGPQGTGAVIVRRGLDHPLSSFMTGGSGIRTFLETMPEDMPASLEAGTQNAHSIAGLLAALIFAEGKRGTWRQQEMELKRQFLQGIREINEQGREPAIVVYGDPDAEDSLPTVAFNLRGYEAGDVADRLWQDKKIAVRAGGHCAPLIHRFFGTGSRGIVRASFSHYNEAEEVEMLLRELRALTQ